LLGRSSEKHENGELSHSISRSSKATTCRPSKPTTVATRGLWVRRAHLATGAGYWRPRHPYTRATGYKILKRGPQAQTADCLRLFVDPLSKAHKVGGFAHRHSPPYFCFLSALSGCFASHAKACTANMCPGHNPKILGIRRLGAPAGAALITRPPRLSTAQPPTEAPLTGNKRLVGHHKHPCRSSHQTIAPAYKAGKGGSA
jgi:hypothetical protein